MGVLLLTVLCRDDVGVPLLTVLQRDDVGVLLSYTQVSVAEWLARLTAV